MNVTEVRIKLVNDVEDRLRAFCSITLDGEFVIRDLKIIQGLRGCFVAMPSRKILERCVKCSGKNEVKARFCSNCGTPLSAAPAEVNGRPRMFADIAHPINAECRERIEGSVLSAFDDEMQKSKQPGYVCRYDEFDE